MTVHPSGGRLHVTDRPGDEPALVLMHGFPDDSRIYDRLVPPLGPRRTVPSTSSDTAARTVRTVEGASHWPQWDEPETTARLIGLANRVVQDDELGATTDELAARLAGQPPLAIRGARRAIDVAWYSDPHASFRWRSTPKRPAMPPMTSRRPASRSSRDAVQLGVARSCVSMPSVDGSKSVGLGGTRSSQSSA